MLKTTKKDGRQKANTANNGMFCKLDTLDKICVCPCGESESGDSRDFEQTG